MNVFTKGVLAGTALAGVFATSALLVGQDTEDSTQELPSVPAPGHDVTRLEKRLARLEQLVTALQTPSADLSELASEFQELSLAQHLLAASVDSVLQANPVAVGSSSESTDVAPVRLAEPTARTSDHDYGVDNDVPVPSMAQRMSSHFWAQNDDPVWGRATEETVRQNWAAADFDTSNLLAGECHTSICRLEVSHENQVARDLFEMDYAQLVPFDVLAVSHPLTSAAPSSGTVLYLALES